MPVSFPEKDLAKKTYYRVCSNMIYTTGAMWLEQDLLKPSGASKIVPSFWWGSSCLVISFLCCIFFYFPMVSSASLYFLYVILYVIILFKTQNRKKTKKKIIKKKRKERKTIFVIVNLDCRYSLVLNFIYFLATCKLYFEVFQFSLM